MPHAAKTFALPTDLGLRPQYTIRRTPQMRGRPQRDSAIFIEGLVTNRFVLSQRAVRPKARRLPPQDAKNFGVEGA